MQILILSGCHQMKFLAPAALFTVSLIIVVALVDVSKVSMARGQRDTQTRMDERFSKAAAAQAELATPCLQSLGLLQSGSTQSRDGDQEKALDCLIKSIQHASDYELVSQIAKEASPGNANMAPIPNFNMLLSRVWSGRSRMPSIVNLRSRPIMRLTKRKLIHGY